MTLSVCMIVKNEERFLEDCLKSVRDVADQIVILDTGSTDRTIEIAQSFNAEIHHFTWQNDFSAARNESIQYATGDWILWLDADERLMPESIPELKKLLRPEPKPLAYIVQIHNLQKDGRNYKLSGAHRLFTNHRGIRFNGRIHEQVVYSLAQLKGIEKEANVRLLHLGYGLDEASQEAKNKRNRKLLEQMVREEPNNAYAHFTLAQNYGLTGEPAKAIKHYKLAWKLQKFTKAMQASLLNTMAEAEMTVGKSQDAYRHCKQSIELIPNQVGAYFLLYKMAEEEKDNEAALKWMQELYIQNGKLQVTAKRISTDVLFDEILLVTEMAGLYNKTGQREKALEELRTLLKKYPDSDEIKRNLLQIASDSGDFALAEQVLNEVQPTDLPLFWDLLGLVLLKQQKFKEAIKVYEHLFQLQPKHFQTVKKLAGLYAKTGDMEKAGALISHLNELSQ